jgi:ParB family transcriptional regulator, chromosome partitioning protein
MTDLEKIIAAARSKQTTPKTDRPESPATPVAPIPANPPDRLPLDQIQPRHQDTRSLNPLHVEALAASIAVLGLIEPLVVDKRGQLLAGGHRLAAIDQLKTTNPAAYQIHFPVDRVPVRSLVIDAEQDPDLALQIEIAENEQRRDYTPTEVKAIADRLKASGYTEVKGRPKRNQKPLMPALAVVVGKNLRTIQRYLADTDPTTESTAKSPTPKSTTPVVLLQQSLTKLKQLQENPPSTKKGKQLTKALPEIIALLEQCLEEN